MTGRYGFHTGWNNLIGHGDEDAREYFDPLKEKTFGHILRSAGYATAVAGKWQLAQFLQNPDHVKQCGFDDYCCWAWQLGKKRTSRYWQPSLWQDGKLRENPEDKYGEDIFCDFLIDFMSHHRDDPFFAYYPMVLVHEPHTPTPDTPHPTAGEKRGEEENGGIDRQRRAQRWFPGMVAYMDKTVGRILAALDQLGERENTIIIFTGDNGTDRTVTSKLGDLSIRGGKGTMTEFGTHVPMLISWKGTIPAGQVKDDLVDFSDIVPTLAELTGAKLPEGVTYDGHSLARQLHGEKTEPRSWVFSQLGHDRLARNTRYMLHSDGRIYDLTNDPFEKQNLAESKDAAVTAAKKDLQAVLDQLK